MSDLRWLRNLHPISGLFPGQVAGSLPRFTATCPVKGVLHPIAALGAEGMTMVVVTHEMGFARSASDTVVFVDHGTPVESGPCARIFQAAQTERLQRFLDHVLWRSLAI